MFPLVIVVVCSCSRVVRYEVIEGQYYILAGDCCHQHSLLHTLVRMHFVITCCSQEHIIVCEVLLAAARSTFLFVMCSWLQPGAHNYVWSAPGCSQEHFTNTHPGKGVQQSNAPVQAQKASVTHLAIQRLEWPSSRSLGAF